MGNHPMKKGEVWLARLPPAAGHTQAGDRPALIVQNDAFLAVLPTVLVVPFTGSLAAARFAGTVTVQPDGQNGLTVPSVALVFQVRALDSRALVRRLGALASKDLDEVLKLLADLTG